MARVPLVDEFDSGVVAISDEQAAELLAYSKHLGSRLAKEIRQTHAQINQFRYLLMTLYDDMRRIKAGREPRYVQLHRGGPIARDPPQR